MAFSTVTAALGFQGRILGSTIVARPPFAFEFNVAASGGRVFDDGTDDLANGSTDYFTGSPSGTPTSQQFYSGFTIEINGNDYALFRGPLIGSDAFFVLPFFAGFEDLTPLIGTAITQTITMPGDSAAAVNLSCFLEGTQIDTPSGAIAVERLTRGSVLRSASGGTVTVKWIGRQRIKPPVNRPWSERFAPVRIAAGALGAGLPHDDLVVTGDHGMVLDGYVINASALVNGTTVDWVPMFQMPRAFTYYHIETENHDVILANGAPAETFIDAAGRAAFDNYGEYLELYGADRIIPQMPLPRISARRLVPESVRARLDTGFDAATEAEGQTYA